MYIYMRVIDIASGISRFPLSACWNKYNPIIPLMDNPLAQNISNALHYTDIAWTPGT